ncbi:putative HTH arsR-type domain-containing protein [Candidatus Magnetomoraceae bacterium gMMP-15]
MLLLSKKDYILPISQEHEKIKRIGLMSRKAYSLADLHWILTSPQGGKLRVELLQTLSNFSFCADEIKCLWKDENIADIKEYLSHLKKFKLISDKKKEGNKVFFRTNKGELAVNALKALISRLGDKQSEKIFKACLGKYSIRFFLKAYGKKWDNSFKNLELFFTYTELGWIAMPLPRSIEGMTAFERLNDAGLLIYKNNDEIYMPSIISRNFFRYLEDLYDITKFRIFKRKLLG